jgi:hypothetical protein
VRARWQAAAQLVADSRDLLDDRPGGADGGPPRALVSRGWDSFLLSLDDRELGAIEVRGRSERQNGVAGSAYVVPALSHVRPERPAPFYGSGCTLCSDAKRTVQRKNM